MPVEKEFPVYGDNGLKGTLLAPSRFLDNSPEKRIRLDNGRELVVPSNALEAQRDGSFYLKDAGQIAGVAPPPEPEPEPQQPEPVIEHPRAGTSMSNPIPYPDSAVNLAEPLLREDCDIERVSIRRLIDAPAETRHEGDMLIVPLMEEVWVVEKRLMLREELHIKMKKSHVSEPGAKPLRKEDLERAS